MSQAIFSISILFVFVGGSFGFGYWKGSALKRLNEQILTYQIIWRAIQKLDAQGTPVWTPTISEETGFGYFPIQGMLDALEHFGALKSYQSFAVPGGRPPHTYYHANTMKEDFV